MHPAFDPQPSLENHTLRLRPLTSQDREPLYTVARDPLIWAGHPARDRHQRTVFMPYLDMLLATGTTLAIIARATDKLIGCSRYYTAPQDPQGISIGYTFLGRDWWGGATNRALKTLMLDHAFTTVSHVWLHIDPTNIRSQRATAKLGARMISQGPLTLGGKTAEWQSWRIEAADWTRTKARRA